MAALLALARGSTGFLTRFGGRRALAGSAAAGVGGSFLGGRLFGDEDRPRRRRRKRVLTQSDRSDIAFIKATIGGPAARDFAAIVAARA